jgi:hypothetical protein
LAGWLAGLKRLTVWLAAFTVSRVLSSLDKKVKAVDQ